MKVTYNWLKNYADFDFSPQELAHQLTMVGLEVDDAAQKCHEFSGVVVGHVLEKKPHPNADRLSVCTVDVRSEMLTIVCGAPNVATGQKVPVALVAARLPGGVEIKRSRIRGITSQGMICSEAELGISSQAGGIMVLGETCEVGEPFESALVAPDVLLDIDVTPNRPDCFGAIGIAREIATLTGTSVRRPDVTFPESEVRTSDKIKVTIQDASKCLRYTARFIADVTIQESPRWLVERLEQIGIRSINNVVDVTNFVMMETGQPLHAFDYDLLRGPQINVRCARGGEKFTTLDDKVHELKPDALLICDAERPVALGGIMGGLNSEVSQKTTRILLESASFEASNIRKTAKTLGIGSESAKRFERGVDPNGAVYALNRATQLISELSGGVVATGFVDEYPTQIIPKTVNLRTDRVEILLGLKVPADKIKSILVALGFEVTGDEELVVQVPTFRPDVTREADLIEEVGRIYGFDNIPVELAASVDQMNQSDPADEFSRNVATALVSFGLSEVVTYNLISQEKATPFLGSGGPLELKNPLSEDLSVLRPSLLPSLLQSVAWNINRKSPDLKFFEIGTTFGVNNESHWERKNLSAVMTGKAFPDSWKTRSGLVDIYHVKGHVDRLLQRIGMKQWTFDLKPCSYSTDSLSVANSAGMVGRLGKLTKKVLEPFKIEADVFFFELDFTALLQGRKREQRFVAIPKFPPVLRDIAVVVSRKIHAADLLKVVNAAGSKLLKQVEIFDVYAGENIEPGFQSIALGLTFYSMERTLTEQEIDKEIETVLSDLAKHFDARLRS